MTLASIGEGNGHMLPKNDLARSILIGVIGLFCVGSYFYAPGKVTVVPTDHALFYDAIALEQEADLIIVAEALGTIDEYEPTIVKNEAGKTEDFYTVFDVQAQKTLKGEVPGEVVRVLQSAVLVPNPLKSKPDLMIRNDVTLMGKGQKYLLFLKETELPGVYSVVSLNQGKFSLDNLDEKELEMEASDQQFKDLKQDVLTRFADQLGS